LILYLTFELSVKKILLCSNYYGIYGDTYLIPGRSKGHCSLAVNNRKIETDVFPHDYFIKHDDGAIEILSKEEFDKKYEYFRPEIKTIDDLVEALGLEDPYQFAKRVIASSELRNDYVDYQYGFRRTGRSTLSMLHMLLNTLKGEKIMTYVSHSHDNSRTRFAEYWSFVKILQGFGMVSDIDVKQNEIRYTIKGFSSIVAPKGYIMSTKRQVIHWLNNFNTVTVGCTVIGILFAPSHTNTWSLNPHVSD
jgi:hypothetical protein